jgi:hypothetical protein
MPITKAIGNSEAQASCVDVPDTYTNYHCHETPLFL